MEIKVYTHYTNNHDWSKKTTVESNGNKPELILHEGLNFGRTHLDFTIQLLKHCDDIDDLRNAIDNIRVQHVEDKKEFKLIPFG